MNPLIVEIINVRHEVAWLPWVVSYFFLIEQCINRVRRQTELHGIEEIRAGHHVLVEVLHDLVKNRGLDTESIHDLRLGDPVDF